MNINLKTIKSNKLFVDSFWSLLGNVIGKGLALIAGILVARYLGKDVYGEYGIIRNTILTVGIFSTFGLGYTATKYIADFKVKNPEKLRVFIKYANRITLVFSGGMAFILFVTADYVAKDVLKIDYLGNALRILSVLIIFNAITATQIGILAGFAKFKELAKINSIIGVLTFLFSVLLTYFFNLEGALLALLIVQVLNCVFNYFVVKKELPINIEYDIKDKELVGKILKFSTPIALQECTYAVASWLSTVLLVRYTTVGDLGMYSAAMQWNAIILFIPGILRNVVLSHLSSNIENKEQHNSILKKTIIINSISTIIPCTLVVIASPFIAKSYGTSFDGLASLISFAVFSTIFTSISNVYAQAFTSLGKNWEMLLIRLVRDSLIIVLFLIMIKVNLFSGAKAMLVSGICLNVLFLITTHIYYKILNNEKIN